MTVEAILAGTALRIRNPDASGCDVAVPPNIGDQPHRSKRLSNHEGCQAVTETSIESIKARKYECFIEDHEPRPWCPGRCAAYAGRTLHLMRCKRKDGFGLGNLFCRQHSRWHNHEG